MNPVEDRVRAALAAHAETFAASPDAWQRIQAKNTRLAKARRGPRGAGWLARHSALVIPAAAAATVAALALGATVIAHGFSSASRGAPPATASRPAPQHDASELPPKEFLDPDPPVSAIFALKVARNVTAWNWIGQPSPLYWFPYVANRPEACHWVAAADGSGSGDCWPLPTLGAARPAVVISNNDYVGVGNPMITGLAEPAVTSVTAMFRDGQRFRGVIGTGRGFGLKAWSVDCPAEQGTKLIFTGSAGQIITELTTAAAAGPIALDLPQPKHGGVTMFSYPATGTIVKAGTVTAYLVDGRAAFFSPESPVGGGNFSPYAAAAQPAVGGMAQPFDLTCTPDCRSTNIKAFGYAHGDVAKVVVRLPSGGHMATATFRAGWAGSDLRLWRITLPDSVWPAHGSQPKLIATAYDAAGRVLGQTQLGQPRD